MRRMIWLLTVLTPCAALAEADAPLIAVFDVRAARFAGSRRGRRGGTGVHELALVATILGLPSGAHGSVAA
jgi:hypothetical protein